MRINESQLRRIVKQMINEQSLKEAGFFSRLGDRLTGKNTMSREGREFRQRLEGYTRILTINPSSLRDSDEGLLVRVFESKHGDSLAVTLQCHGKVPNPTSPSRPLLGKLFRLRVDISRSVMNIQCDVGEPVGHPYYDVKNVKRVIEAPVRNFEKTKEVIIEEMIRICKNVKIPGGGADLVGAADRILRA